jgi:hypothetical protein
LAAAGLPWTLSALETYAFYNCDFRDDGGNDHWLRWHDGSGANLGFETDERR